MKGMYVPSKCMITEQSVQLFKCHGLCVNSYSYINFLYFTGAIKSCIEVN